MPLRKEVLDEMDIVYSMTEGKVPDHLIVSETVWNEMEENSKFEQLSDDSNPKRPGFLGMRVWYSRALDERGAVGLLMSEQAFRAMVPKARDYR